MIRCTAAYAAYPASGVVAYAGAGLDAWLLQGVLIFQRCDIIANTVVNLLLDSRPLGATS